MSPGPLRQIAGALGLVALVPTALMLASGGIGVSTAAIRAVVTLVVVTVVGRVLGNWLDRAARRYEHAAERAHDPKPQTGRRRIGGADRPVGARSAPPSAASPVSQAAEPAQSPLASASGNAEPADAASDNEAANS